MLADIQAQDKYEYAVITCIPFNRIIEISKNGITHEKIIVPKEEVKSDRDVNAALKQMNKMFDEGWELFDTGFSIVERSHYEVYVFYLKKKKQ